MATIGTFKKSGNDLGQLATVFLKRSGCCDYGIF